MSIRSFDHTGDGPDRNLDSEFLHQVKISFLNSECDSDYLCVHARRIDKASANFNESRMHKLLTEFGVNLDGSHFCSLAEQFWDSPRGRRTMNLSSHYWVANQVSRLVLLNAMIAKLEREGR